MKTIALLTPLAFGLALTPSLAADPVSGWSGTVAHLIAAKQVYPRSAQIKGEEGTTQLRIGVAPDGSISQVVVTASSGSPILDHQAQAVVNEIGKLPPPPAGIHSLSLPITWRLN